MNRWAAVHGVRGLTGRMAAAVHAGAGSGNRRRIDPGRLSHANRTALLLELRNLTRPGGVNVIVPGEDRAAPEGYLSHYPDWDREHLGPARRGKAAKTRGVILAKP